MKVNLSMDDIRTKVEEYIKKAMVVLPVAPYLRLIM